MSETSQKVAEIVKAALELPAGEREIFVEQACGADGELRSEVESLLQFQPEASQFIEQGALHVAARAQAAALAPEMPLLGEIDGYEVISRIGVGGMGDVYLARDTKLGRRAALKLVRAGMDSADLVSRFRHEERILASLNHPNIAQLFGAGLAAGGTPYFAMEYVEGRRIDEYCRAKALSTHARLELFRKVCAAVHYAHQRLVIHRDLKPSNILVTAEGEPKLLDFGIAKLIEGNDALTQMQTLATGVMTPDYASPEQVRGEAMTTATDVYSLGVLLYELLTGQRPYRLKTRSPDEIARAITGQEPERPSTAIARSEGNPTAQIPNPKLLQGDLDNIVLMALRKEPQRRYASVAQFSEDIRRYFTGRPVLAHKDTLRYRAGKFIKRNKAGVVAAALIFISLVTGLATALWQANVARRERDRAERRFADVRQLSNALLNDIAPKIENLQGATAARQAVVTQSLKYLDSLAQETTGDLPLQSELATAYEKVGDIQGNPENPNLGDLAGAIASYEKARKMRLELLQSDPNDFERRRLLAGTYRSLGYLHWQANELKESTRQTETALGLYEKLAAERPDSSDLRLALAQTTFDLGDARKDASTYVEANAYFQRALELLAPLLQTDPNHVRYLKLAGNCHSKLGNSLSWQGQQQEGEAATQKAILIYESLAANHPNDVSVTNGLWQTYWLAISTYEDQNNALSHEYAVKALKTIQAVVDRDPADSLARYRLARTLSNVGQATVKADRAAEGIPYLEKSVSELSRLVTEDPRSGGTKGSLGAALMRLAEARAKLNDFAGAISELERAEQIYISLHQADTTDSTSLRSQALTWDFKAQIHVEWAKTVQEEQRRAHEDAARDSFARTLQILEQVAARKTLPEADRQWLEKLRAGLSTPKQ
jgi:serine/threonine protein kinase